MRVLRTLSLATLILVLSPDAGSAADAPRPAARTPHSWLVTTPDSLKSSGPPADDRSEIANLRAVISQRSLIDIQRILWWNVGGPAYRWNEVAIEALLDDFITLPLAARHLALLHAAIDDAVAAVWREKALFKRPRPSAADPSIATAVAVPASFSYPSDFAAAAEAAAAVLADIFPARASAFRGMAEEVMQDRLKAGLEYPSDVAAGREIGRKVAALAIAYGKADSSEGKWTGVVPKGPGKWEGINPITPLAAGWRPWVLTRPDEFRPAAPPAFDSDEVRAQVAELKAFARTPKSNHHAIYWEVFGGARAFALWNEIARTKLLEYGETFDAPTSARLLTAVNIALLDSAIACWDAKYTYWMIRPSQLDPELKPAFPPPNHPSYPSAHGCLSTAAATLLAALFPRDRDRLLALGGEAAEARIWAGIHYRFDIDAGREIGRKVAVRTLERAFVSPTP